MGSAITYGRPVLERHNFSRSPYINGQSLGSLEQTPHLHFTPTTHILVVEKLFKMSGTDSPFPIDLKQYKKYVVIRESSDSRVQNTYS